VYSANFYDSLVNISNTGIGDFINITNSTNNLFIEKVNYGFIEVGDSIRPQQNGLYDISISYSAYADAVQTDIYEIGVFKNGVLQYKGERTFSQNSRGGVPFEIPISLTPSDWISFRIANVDDASRSSIFVNAAYNIKFITSE